LGFYIGILQEAWWKIYRSRSHGKWRSGRARLEARMTARQIIEARLGHALLALMADKKENHT
jgi:hypothetical protein